jgi:hypothetical protein
MGIPPLGRFCSARLGQLGLVTLLRLPCPPLGLGPLEDQAPRRLATHATPAEVVVYDLAVDLARERLDHVTRAFGVRAVPRAEPLAGQLGQRDQLGLVDRGGAADSLSGLDNGVLGEHVNFLSVTSDGWWCGGGAQAGLQRW